jgi:hypothetical protein
MEQWMQLRFIVRYWAWRGDDLGRQAPQHFLYFLPLPQGQSSFRPGLGAWNWIVFRLSRPPHRTLCRSHSPRKPRNLSVLNGGFRPVVVSARTPPDMTPTSTVPFTKSGSLKMERQVLEVSAFRAPAGTLISCPSDRRMQSAIPACIGHRCAVSDRIADNRVDMTRPIAKIWVNSLSAWCDTTRASARR